MDLFNKLTIKFEHPDWSKNPEFGLIDAILEENPGLIKLLEEDITTGTSQSNFGRKDSPTVEQVVRAAINRIAIGNGYESLKKLRQDSTVVQSNIHYPTNNALVWDCIRESTRLLYQLQEEIETLAFMDYTKTAKKY